jgi:hypothetical protein
LKTGSLKYEESRLPPPSWIVDPSKSCMKFAGS